MDRYFNKFPTVSYNGVVCTDISRSARFISQSKNQAALFYPIEIDAGFRSDNLADAYYSDAELEWLIWLSNDIVDPYYEWYLSEVEFDAFINEKYGSYEDAVKEVRCYRNNWYKLEETITPSYYDNNIAFDLKKYYTPEYGGGGKIVSYKRKEEDWKVNTNRIISYEISSNSLFQTGEIIDIKYNGDIVAGGTVAMANSSKLILQHVSGELTANSTLVKELIGETSGVSTTTSSSQILQINLSDQEAIYWSAMTAFDYETELNESRKNLYLINSEYSFDISEQLRLRLKE